MLTVEYHNGVHILDRFYRGSNNSQMKSNTSSVEVEQTPGTEYENPIRYNTAHTSTTGDTNSMGFCKQFMTQRYRGWALYC